jgi:hypothetical protein
MKDLPPSGAPIKGENFCTGMLKSIYRIMRKKSGLFIRESVIGLGFLSGLWTAIGINPQTIFLTLVERSADEVLHDPFIGFFFLVLPTVLLLLSLVTAYKRGKVIGLISVFFAYAGGLVVLESLYLSGALLVIAIVLGLFATSKWH